MPDVGTENWSRMEKDEFYPICNSKSFYIVDLKINNSYNQYKLNLVLLLGFSYLIVVSFHLFILINFFALLLLFFQTFFVCWFVF